MTVASEPLRWAVQVSKWQPTEGQWSVVLQSLPQEVQERCMRFRQLDDQKRAVVSQLLQRACIRIVHGEDWGRIDIQRTKGSKPYYAGAIRNPHAPNFNYNVSHEGDYVVLACESHCLCGVDVSAPQQIRRKSGKSLLETLSIMKQQLTPREWSLLQSLSDDESALEATFQAIWSCKEAFIKARGDGLAFEPLSRIDVQLPPKQHTQQQAEPAATKQADTTVVTAAAKPAAHSSTCSACCCCWHNGQRVSKSAADCSKQTSSTVLSDTQQQQELQQQQQQRQQQLAWLSVNHDHPVRFVDLIIDGDQQPRWRVFVQQLPNNHWVAVARGPPEAAVDQHEGFKSTFLEPCIPDRQMQEYLAARSPPFDLMQVEDLLPDHVANLYDDAA